MTTRSGPINRVQLLGCTSANDRWTQLGTFGFGVSHFALQPRQEAMHKKASFASAIPAGTCSPQPACSISQHKRDCCSHNIPNGRDVPREREGSHDDRVELPRFRGGSITWRLDSDATTTFQVRHCVAVCVPSRTHQIATELQQAPPPRPAARRGQWPAGSFLRLLPVQRTI